MALTVETGSGVTDADSYVSVEDADAYHAKYGNDEWEDIEDARKEVLLRIASRDIDIIYGRSFVSTLLTLTQGLLWPRTAFLNSSGISVTGIPSQLKAAVCELALIENEVNILGADDFEGNIKSTTVKLGPLEDSVEYFSDNGGAAYNHLGLISALLGNLITVRSSHYATILR